jgi:predicted site-specific integrase-resolvase
MPKVIAYSYARVSSAPQAYGAGIGRQLEAAALYAGSKGYELDETLRDIGRSAYSGEHRKGALGGFLAAVEKGRIARGSVLMIEAMDRLSREEVIDAMLLVTGLITSGISIATLEDQILYSRDTIKENQSLMYVLVGKMQQANQYSERLSMRVTHGKAVSKERKLKEGKALTVMCPAWIRVVDGTYQVIPERAAIVRRIFDELEAGQGKETIVGRLNQEKVPTFDRAGQGMAGIRKTKGWHLSYLGKLIANSAVVGDYTPAKGGDVVQGHFGEGVISRQQLERVRAGRKPAGRRGRQYRNVLTGLMRCGRCGASMIAKHKGERWPDAVTRRKAIRSSSTYLVCDSAFRKTGCTDRGLMPYDLIESATLRLATRLTGAQEWYADQDDGGETKELTVQIEKCIVGIDGMKRGIHNALEKLGADPSPTVLGWITKNEAGIAKLQAEREKLEVRLSNRTSKKLPERDYEELLMLAQEARNEPDMETRYDMRARMHLMLLTYVDLIRIWPTRKKWNTWAGKGYLLSAHEMVGGKDTSILFYVGRKKMLILKDSESTIVETSPTILKESNLLRDGGRPTLLAAGFSVGRPAT